MTASHEGGDQAGAPFGDYSGYKVYDDNREHIGKVDDLFVDAYDRPEYMGVKMGFLGTSSTLIPMEIVRVNDERELVQIQADKERIKEGPAFDDDQEIDADYERRVREHYGLGESPDSSERGSFGSYYTDLEDPDVDLEYGERSGDEGAESLPHERDAAPTGPTGEGEVFDQRDQHDELSQARASRAREESGAVTDRGRGDQEERSGEVGPGMAMGDREGGEFVEHPPGEEGVGERDSDVEDEDELRVQRSEEELAATKREREAGKVNVRKRVRTDRERMTVPKKHEEVKVERVPASGEASEGEIGDQEVSMPVTEEEVEVTKRAVKKEEIRVRKEAVEDEEVVEEDLRKEEVEVEGEEDLEGNEGNEDRGRS
ncbi:PRC and DUF2382 domain-containing protein [Rubrobacter aplysinae]|uniref:PRC and DUF2382 domain-containing protein n=1 Tax=Rubrobacter aplysinae TaxID=909625 RepID=UPI00069E3DE2|nr:PRC and DUF2382 domain-containing protein [Rubrobacter aplysinae]